MRMTFSEIQKHSKIDKEFNILTVLGREVGFVYYRSGY
jgi:hypothetical protein